LYRSLQLSTLALQVLGENAKLNAKSAPGVRRDKEALSSGCEATLMEAGERAIGAVAARIDRIEISVTMAADVAQGYGAFLRLKTYAV
jgi:hypothetical protein